MKLVHLISRKNLIVQLLRVLCIISASWYILFDYIFHLIINVVPLPIGHRAFFASVYLVILVLSYRILFVKKYLVYFVSTAVLISLAHIAFLWNIGQYRQGIWYLLLIIMIGLLYLIFRDVKSYTQCYEELFEEAPMAIALFQIVFDNNGEVIDFYFFQGNRAFENLVDLQVEDILGRTISEILPGVESTGLESFKKVVVTGEQLQFETHCQEIDKDLDIKAYKLNSNKFVTVLNDISSRKEAEEELRYMTFHDSLTGLYNRRFFEEELQRLDTQRQLPLSIIIADVNGLKMVNDSLGHQEGDKLLIKFAEILKDTCRYEDIIARWGGDEFAILLSNTTKKQAANICSRIRKKSNDSSEKPIKLSISLGYATKTEMLYDMSDVLKQAENFMYTNKSMNSQSNRRALIRSLQRILKEKAHEIEQHIHNMQLLTVELGKQLGLKERELNEISMLAAVHDIGKIAIPESVLQKPNSLSADEWVTIKRHPEIGYRIALSSVDLIPVAEGILSHHEWWDGTGYPQGLKGDQIPLSARIVAIVDSFEVMISERPYGDTFSVENALQEIKRGAGTQFDLRIVEVFLEMMKDPEIISRLKFENN